ncbi:putative HTH-type transcriptional regulator [Clostridium tepidiprofundi DSM 19306]|uniref:Putative HTH-type transcriptional regulator n=1 Tax=Clostridium tepidiprofundi DSM 19306 TaxID=1121338 RepID=A0A151ASI6_9CLOT|nr:LytTR family DNA-binding domain-containing protein [Clostridium tepidiprofundi]KYH30611.1 putative HTH-type transcriptional regulator [Clostridium tepidiprofundi DSM 19306]
MKVEIVVKPELKDTHIVIYTNEITNEIQGIVDSLSNSQNRILTGIKDKKIFLLEDEEIYCFYSENQKVYAKTTKGKLWIKQKLYELENIYDGTSFIRISKSCIVNIDKIKNLDISYVGTIEIVFKNGEREYVSRRYISKIKKYLGI